MFSKTLIRIGMIGAVCAVAGAVWRFTLPQQAAIRSGSTAFSALQDGIHKVTYETRAAILTASRAGAGGRFAVDVRYGDGRPEQRCGSSADLDGVLPRLAEIKARRALTLEQVAAEFPVQVGVLTLEDRIAAEPVEPFTVYMTGDRSSVALVYDNTAFEAVLEPKIFVRLEAGCAELAAK
ncbi:hypothetical protein [Massilia rhizosphaerae]|uniref:hypothetical protein n=1 Tax=Massilia rhizosphaerae TaxID=2784389 RepID=UPI0018DDAC4F|nr:hypothetical protein [Massilia rhizosphaerae]